MDHHQNGHQGTTRSRRWRQRFRLRRRSRPRALEEAGVLPEEVTHVFVATCTPDYLCPSTACVIASKLGISAADGRMGNVMCLDFNAACTGFVYGLELARNTVQSHPDAVVLLVATEALSRRTNFTDRTTCVLFGDAAGAVVIRSEEKGALWQLRDVVCSSDGSLHDLIKIGGGSACHIKEGDAVGADWFISMQGMAVFKHAVRSMTEESQTILARNGISLDELDLFILIRPISESSRPWRTARHRREQGVRQRAALRQHLRGHASRGHGRRPPLRRAQTGHEGSADQLRRRMTWGLRCWPSFSVVISRKTLSIPPSGA